MNGLSKYFNTKQDYLNCVEAYPQEMKDRLQALLYERFVWVDRGEIQAGDIPMEDDSHRIVVDEEGKKCQMELVEDENARIFQLGFTVAEVEELIAGLK